MVTLGFMLEKDIEVTLLCLIERLQVRTEGTNKQVTGVCIDCLHSTIVMSLNTGYGLYRSYIKMTDGLHISLHRSLLMKPIVTCQMQLKN